MLFFFVSDSRPPGGWRSVIHSALTRPVSTSFLCRSHRASRSRRSRGSRTTASSRPSSSGRPTSPTRRDEGGGGQARRGAGGGTRARGAPPRGGKGRRRGVGRGMREAVCRERRSVRGARRNLRGGARVRAAVRLMRGRAAAPSCGSETEPVLVLPPREGLTPPRRHPATIPPPLRLPPPGLRNRDCGRAARCSSAST